MNIEQQRAAFEAERELFKAHHAKLFDLTEDADTWGRPKFKHPNIEAMWYGWRDRAAAIELDRQGRGEPVGYFRVGSAGLHEQVFRTHYNDKDVFPLFSAQQPANPTIKESLTVAEPVKEVSAPDGLWQQAYDKAWSVSHLYHTGAGMLYWLEAEHKRLVASTAPANGQAQQGANMVTCACGDMHPATSYGAGFINAAGMCENCHAAACVAPMSNNPACGAQNAEHAPQLRDWEIPCDECCGEGHVIVRRQVAERVTDVITSREPCEVCGERGYVIAHEDVPGMRDHLPDATKMVGPAMAGDGRAEFEAWHAGYGIEEGKAQAWAAWEALWKRVQPVSGEDAKDAARYRLAAEHLILVGGGGRFGWPLAPMGKAQWDKYLDRAMQQERQP